jgi:predicted transcriptional regulator
MAQEEPAMSMQSLSEAESFYSYVGDALNRGEGQLPLVAIVQKWQAEREMEESCAAIREGLSDIEAGRVQSLEDFDREFRSQHGLPPRRRA